MGGGRHALKGSRNGLFHLFPHLPVWSTLEFPHQPLGMTLSLCGFARFIKQTSHHLGLLNNLHLLHLLQSDSACKTLCWLVFGWQSQPPSATSPSSLHSISRADRWAPPGGHLGFILLFKPGLPSSPSPFPWPLISPYL